MKESAVSPSIKPIRNVCLPEIKLILMGLKKKKIIKKQKGCLCEAAPKAR